MALQSFNPCFDGISFHTLKDQAEKSGITGFNPCFDGISFHTSYLHNPSESFFTVSILVLMESPFIQEKYRRYKKMGLAFQSLF